MKKTFLLLAVAFAMVGSAQAFTLNDIFGSGGLGDILGNIQSTIESATASTNFTIDQLTGTWKYSSPGVQFESDNALQKIGGAAAASAVENKLSPYYIRAGIDKLTLTVDNAHNFVIKTKYGSFKGTIEKGTDSKLVFNFKAFGKINIGRINVMATKSGSMLNLAFDAKKLVTIAQKISSLSKNSSLQSIADILSKYEGIYVGVKLRK